MTKHEWFTFLKEETARMVTLSQAKNDDYTGTSANPFANFELVESMGLTDSVTGVLVRMMDKVARIKSFHQKGALSVKDESVMDTCRDLAVYSLILGAMFTDKRRQLVPVQPAMFVDDEREYATRILPTKTDNTTTICLTQSELDEIRESWIAP